MAVYPENDFFQNGRFQLFWAVERLDQSDKLPGRRNFLQLQMLLPQRYRHLILGCDQKLTAALADLIPELILALDIIHIVKDQQRIFMQVPQAIQNILDHIAGGPDAIDNLQSTESFLQISVEIHIQDIVVFFSAFLAVIMQKKIGTYRHVSYGYQASV